MNYVFLSKFNALMQSADGNIGQCWAEWQAFLEFAAGYFDVRGMNRITVVEIGVWRNAQKPFYEQVLGADHIGIDIDKTANPDILGDSQSLATVEKLTARLDGRPIDLLFIDGHHSYMGIKRDFEVYGPMTRHIIAVHDFMCETHPDVRVNEFWRELRVIDKDHLFIEFHKPRAHELGTIWDGQEMGIGVMVKE